ncbi:hypothetical protein [Cellulomonas triticagri]|uniref:hypothetical protein n=1 Tax=Cellulomonas triticagri TaxID=2483352 RepID=UPI0011C3E095|nr:hypothetical protein [Cellulomonas triticagri]
MRRKVASVATATALSLGLLAGAGGPAVAGDGGRVSAGQAIAGGTAAGDGWRITGVTSTGAAFLGPLHDPTGSGEWVWCINFGLAVPAGSVSVQSVSDANSAAMAWLLQRLQHDPGSLGVGDRGLSNAAGSYLVHMHYEEGNKAAVSAEARKGALAAAAWPALTAEADRLWDLATANANLTATTEVQTYRVGQRTGVVTNIGIQNRRGEWIPGIDFTSTLTTGAVWDTNGNGIADPGESAVYSGVTTNGPITLPWVATPGVHDVHANTRYPMTQATLEALRAGAGIQDSIRRGPDDPQILESAGVRFRAVGSFQPVVTTRVVQEVVDAGQGVPDRVTFAAKAGEQWIAGTRVCADGVLYGPYASEQPASNQVPAGAPVAGRASACASEPSTVVAGSQVVAPNSGVYTWVWSISRSAQAQPELITGDYTDGFFTAGETSYARLRMGLSSAVASHTQVMSKGQTVVDSFTIAPVEAGDLWLAPEGVPVEVPMIAEISTPVSEEGLEVAGVSQAIRFTASQFGTYTTGTDEVPAFASTGLSGAYSVRLSVDTAALSERTRFWLDEAYHDATDGWWAPDETFVVRMAPEISTQVAERFFDQESWDAPAEFVVVDHVTAWLRDAGDVWLTQGGVPVGIPADNTFWGMFDQPMAPAPLSVAPAGHEIGTERVVFTEPGTLSTAGETRTTGVGFGTWTTVVEGDPLWFEPFESRFFEESETVSVRRAVKHSSIVREYSVDGGDLAFDTVTNARLSPTAGLFDGLGGWAPDAQAATMSLYAIDREPDTTEVPDDAVLIWTCDYADLIRNGTYEIGWGAKGDCDRVDIPEPLYPDGTWYVFVYDHPGDDRHVPYTSPFDDLRERMFDKTVPPPPPVEPEPGIPALVTQAVVVADDTGNATSIPVARDSTYDVIRIVAGEGEQFPPGSTAVSELYFAPDGQPLVCNPTQSVFVSEVIELLEDVQEYVTDSFTTAAGLAGTYGWVESAHDAGGALLSRGVCGEPAETFDVISVSTTLGHEDTNGDGLAGAGDELWDDIHLVGAIGDGVQVELTSTVYQVDAADVTWGDAAINTGAGNITVNPDVCTPDAVFTELTVAEEVTGPGTYATDRFTVPEAGDLVVGGLTMVETATLTTDDGSETRTVTGECGAPEESVGPVYFGAGSTAASVGAGGGDALARTGVERLAWMLAAAVLLAAAGGTVARAAERRKHAAQDAAAT